MNILIIDDVHDALIEGLGNLGYVVSYQPMCTREELIQQINQFDGLIVRTKTHIDQDVLSHTSKLKFIGRAGAGVDNIDTAYCDENGIVYFNSGEANADAVGEQATGMLLVLFANILKADGEVRKGIWDREGNRGIELKGKTVGIIGYGNTGKAFAKKLSGFEVKVLAYDKYLKNYSDGFATEAAMDQIYKEADVLSFHVPLTLETMHLGSSNLFSQFQKPICLLNLSRGKVVALKDLIQFMNTNRVWSAALDVLENEKLSTLTESQKDEFDYLVSSNRLVLTPHIGGWTHESYKKISLVLLQKIKELS